jgi:PAS domain S-box-containing protein
LNDTSTFPGGDSAGRGDSATLAALDEALNGLTWTARPDGTLADLAPLARVTGRPVEDLVRDGWQSAIHPDDREATIRLWTAAVAAGRRFSIAYRFLCADGSARWFASRAAPVRDAEGRIVRWAGLSVDIHEGAEREAEERDRAEAVVREGEARFRTLADLLPQMVWSTRPDGFHDYFNQRWYDFTGVPPGSTDGEGWNGIFHPEDQDRAFATWRHSLETGEFYQIEYRLRRRDGVYRWVLGRALPMRDRNGRIERWFGTCTDIDDLKRTEAALHASEARFRSLVEATASIVWSRAPSGEFVGEQEAWGAFTGQPRDAYTGRGWLDAVHPDDRARTVEAWDRAVATGTIYQVEHRLRRPDGSYTPMMVRATPLLDTGGRVAEWVGIHTDISGLKAAESALRALNETLETQVNQRTAELVRARIALEQANRDLESTVAARTAALQSANEEIKRFAYIVSHDLRAPLVNIMGFTSELEAARPFIADFHARAVQAAPDLAGGEMQHLVERDLDEAIGFIRASTAKMDRLINAILTLSRAERRILAPEAVDMTALLTAFGDSLAHQFAEREATYRVDPLPEVTADRLALEQVFSNLVENAVKYLRTDRPGRVTVTGSESADEVSYTVADNGRGIERKDFGRIFELFRRAGVQDRPGEGIGLAHVQALVRKLGGRISVDSTPGEGSAFTVTLPKVYREYRTP